MIRMFTTGRWRVSKEHPWNILAPRPEEPGRLCIVASTYVQGTPRETYEANAHLIAASPDMFDSLQQAIEWAEAYTRIGTRNPPEFLDAARAAIAKAKGELQC